MRTNKGERKVLKSLLKSLDYLNASILRSDETNENIEDLADYKYGIESIICWLRKNGEDFNNFYNEITK